MKKSLLPVTIFCIGVLSASAQITITTADVATASKIIYQETDTLPTVSVGTPGASQTWNMALLNLGKKDTLSFLNASWHPNSAFPTSNLALKQGYQDFYSYLINASTGLTVVGNAGTNDFGNGPVAITQINNPSEILMNFPATYNTTYTNNFTTTTPAFYLGITVPPGITLDSARAKSVVSKTVLVDAWGSITTPLGTYNVIRSKETKIKHDTTDIYAMGAWNPLPGYTPQIAADSTVSFTWWANGIGFPIASATMDSTGAVKSVQWLKVLPVTGINEITSSVKVNVFPNPADNELNMMIDGAKTESVQVFDITGRLMNTYAVENNTVLINTSAFANGIYTYSIIGKENGVLDHGKFTVAK